MHSDVNSKCVIGRVVFFTDEHPTSLLAIAKVHKLVLKQMETAFYDEKRSKSVSLDFSCLISHSPCCYYMCISTLLQVAPAVS